MDRLVGLFFLFFGASCIVLYIINAWNPVSGRSGPSCRRIATDMLCLPLIMKTLTRKQDMTMTAEEMNMISYFLFFILPPSVSLACVDREICAGAVDMLHGGWCNSLFFLFGFSAPQQQAELRCLLSLLLFCEKAVK